MEEKSNRIAEDMVYLYFKLSIYFSLDEARRAEMRQDLPLPESAKDLTDEELYYVYRYVDSYLKALSVVKEATEQINSLPDTLQKEKIVNVLIDTLKVPIIDTLKGPLGSTLELR